MRMLSLLLRALMAALLVAILRAVWRLGPGVGTGGTGGGPGIVDVLRAIGRGQARTLVDNFESIPTGASTDTVRRIVGSPDRETPGEWVYYLDKHSGYRVRFGGDSRVSAVQAWVS